MDSRKRLAEHDVYDATSRSVSIHLPTSLSQPNLSKDELPINMRRLNFGTPNMRSFVIHNFLSVEECNTLVDNSEQAGYLEHSDLKAEYPPKYRNNQRLIFLSNTLALNLWNRLLPHLKEHDIKNITPYGYGTNGIWIPRGLNDGFIFNKYSPNQYFKPHYDGFYVSPQNLCSIYTVLIYLNKCFDGGKLIFHKSREDPEIIATYKPVTGDAIIFPADLFHEGEMLNSGTKYVLRTNIMFECVENLSVENFKNDPKWHEMYQLFSTFDLLSYLGDVGRFTQTFIEAQKIQLSKSGCRHDPPIFFLPIDIFEYLCQYLDAKILLGLMSVSKGWHLACRSEVTWKALFETRFPHLTVNAKFDWIGEYKKALLATKQHVIVLGYPVTYSTLNQMMASRKRISMKEGAPWDYSFVAPFSDRTWQCLEFLVQQSIFSNQSSALKLLVVIFRGHDNIEYNDHNDYVIACSGDNRHKEIVDARYVGVGFGNLFHCSGHPMLRPPAKFMANVSYIEANIAALFFFGLRNALVVCYYPVFGFWEMTKIEDSKISDLAPYQGDPPMYKKNSKISEIVNSLGDSILNTLEQSATKFCHNIIFCMDVYNGDPDEKESKKAPNLCPDESPFGTLSEYLIGKNPNVNIWTITDHKQLVKGAMLFSESPEFATLPTFKRLWGYVSQ